MTHLAGPAPASTPSRGARLAGTSHASRAAAGVALGLALSLSACSSGGSATSLASVTAAAQAPVSGAALDAAAFAAAAKRPGTVILDVRTPAEFAAGHLAGARNIDVEAADFTTRIAALAKDVPYAVYCRSGNRSATALAIMAKQGFTAAYHLAGGITAWTAAGGPTTTS